MAASCKIGIEFAQGDFVLHGAIVLEDTNTNVPGKSLIPVPGVLFRAIPKRPDKVFSGLIVNFAEIL